MAKSERLLVVDKKNIHSATMKKIGRDPKMKYSEDGKTPVKSVRFMSDIKERMLMIEDYYFIKFQNHMYETDDKDDIEWIKSCSVFNNGIWEGKFPKEVILKMEDDRKHISRNLDTFEPGT
jgi:hypothetical protein